MLDRRHTETKTLQIAWSALALAVGAVGLALAPDRVGPLALVAWGSAWMGGLLVLGWRERRHWRHLVETSAFERGASAGVADLERIVHGQSVAVSTDVPGLLSRTHTVVATTVDGVDAEFTVSLTHVGSGGTDAGLPTGNPALDAAWVIEGGERNASLVLTTDVQSALMDVAVPCTMTVTGSRVEVRVPFTRLTADELSAVANAVTAVAVRLEAVGRGSTSPTG